MLTLPTPSHNPYIVAWCVTLIGAKGYSFTMSLLFLVTFILPHSFNSTPLGLYKGVGYSVVYCNDECLILHLGNNIGIV